MRNPRRKLGRKKPQNKDQTESSMDNNDQRNSGLVISKMKPSVQAVEKQINWETCSIEKQKQKNKQNKTNLIRPKLDLYFYFYYYFLFSFIHFQSPKPLGNWVVWSCSCYCSSVLFTLGLNFDFDSSISSIHFCWHFNFPFNQINSQTRWRVGFKLGAAHSTNIFVIQINLK